MSETNENRLHTLLTFIEAASHMPQTRETFSAMLKALVQETREEALEEAAVLVEDNVVSGIPVDTGPRDSYAYHIRELKNG